MTCKAWRSTTCTLFNKHTWIPLVGCTIFNWSLEHFYDLFLTSRGKKRKVRYHRHCSMLARGVLLLAHLSWKLKWAILIAFCPSSVCLSVCLSVNFYIFDFFSRTTGSILARLGINHPWAEGIQVCSNKGDCPSPRGDKSKRVKIHWKF
jgi:hypothetical protein